MKTTRKWMTPLEVKGASGVDDHFGVVAGPLPFPSRHVFMLSTFSLIRPVYRKFIRPPILTAVLPHLVCSCTGNRLWAECVLD